MPETPLNLMIAKHIIFPLDLLVKVCRPADKWGEGFFLDLERIDWIKLGSIDNGC